MKSSSDDQHISIAYSSDSDDAFMLWALENKKIAWTNFSFTFYRADIQELNTKAMQGEFDVSAISAAAYPRVAHYYQLLDVGTSVANAAGPIVLSKEGMSDWRQLRGKRIAVPGLNTTAYMALRRIMPDFAAVPMHFLRIMPAVLSGKVDAGVVIHELQLTYAQHGFTKILDLGAVWQERYQLPLPLGVNVIAKRLPWGIRQQVAALLRASIEYGLTHRQETLAAATTHAETDIGIELGDVYIERYVNAQTLQLDNETRQGLDFLLQGEPVLEMPAIAAKIQAGGVMTRDEAVYLFEQAELLDVMQLADAVNRERNHAHVYYNVNRHINPTNICVLSCKFCSFSRKPGEEGAFALSHKEIQQRAQQALAQGATEVHLVGGLHPRWRYDDMLGVVAAVKQAAPALHIKAYTAVEIEWMARRGRKSIEQVLRDLQTAGLGSLPGGGAEIFHPQVRDKICDTKVDAETWLHIHRTSHRLGLRSNATMLYGHIENYAHRVDHMLRLRDLQEETGGFNVFIPLAFQPHGNEMGIETYTCGADDLKTIAVARLLLHNFHHIKAYWVMLGTDIAQLALHAGANDLDGTVEDEKISHLAGGRAGKALPEQLLTAMISSADKVAVERDSLYKPLRITSSPHEHTVRGDKSPVTQLAHSSLLELAERLRRDNLLSDNLTACTNDNHNNVLRVENFRDLEQRVLFIERLLMWRDKTPCQHVHVIADTSTTAVEWLRACALCRLVLGREVGVIAVSEQRAALDKLRVPLRLWGVTGVVSPALFA